MKPKKQATVRQLAKELKRLEAQHKKLKAEVANLYDRVNQQSEIYRDEHCVIT